MDHKCHCNPKDNFDWNGYSCKFWPLHTLSSHVKQLLTCEKQVPHATTSSTRWTSPQAGSKRTADGPSDASLGPSSCSSCFPSSSAVSSFCFPFALCSTPYTLCATNAAAMSLLAPINPCRSEKIFIRTRDIGWLFADVLFFVLGIGGRECRNTSQGGHEHGVFEERG